MRVTCLQMDVQFTCVEENFLHAEKLIGDAMKDAPDVIVLPETWNTGFFPRENLTQLADRDCGMVCDRIGALAKKYAVNIVAGSVSNLRNGKVYNTACVFDRAGSCIAQYDKTHLFSPMGEDQHFAKGDHLCRFTLDGVSCGLIICYDLRFPELVRTLALSGMEMLFVVSQWPDARIPHLRVLCTARAIENQCYVVNCNSCGTAGETRYGGHSGIYDPLGGVLARAGSDEETIYADCDLSALAAIRQAIPVFHDRRPELYN